VNRQEHFLNITCEEVWRELSNYMEGDVTAEMRERIAQHLNACAHCQAVYDGSRNVVQLVGNGKTFELPSGFSRRLYGRLQAELRSGLRSSSVE
jgi:anti-sigma factor (TIGR02949 family)